jgi:hypothetical protein
MHYRLLRIAPFITLPMLTLLALPALAQEVDVDDDDVEVRTRRDTLPDVGFVVVEYAKAPGGSSSAVSIGPRVGYNLPLAARMSVWPKAGVAIARTSQSDDGATLPNGVVLGEDDDSNTSFQLNLFVPVMFHPVQHFFLGLGPALDQDLTGDSKATTVAVRLTLGGWI